jgi:hypothetical protein
VGHERRWMHRAACVRGGHASPRRLRTSTSLAFALCHVSASVRCTLAGLASGGGTHDRTKVDKKSRRTLLATGASILAICTGPDSGDADAAARTRSSMLVPSCSSRKQAGPVRAAEGGGTAGGAAGSGTANGGGSVVGGVADGGTALTVGADTREGIAGDTTDATAGSTRDGGGWGEDASAGGARGGGGIAAATVEGVGTIRAWGRRPADERRTPRPPSRFAHVGGAATVTRCRSCCCC